jgi:hypothetical protein
VPAVFQYRAFAAAMPNAETVTKIVLWFAPRIDHWVKLQIETRNGGRLASKTSQELIEYKIK